MNSEISWSFFTTVNAEFTAARSTFEHFYHPTLDNSSHALHVNVALLGGFQDIKAKSHYMMLLQCAITASSSAEKYGCYPRNMIQKTYDFILISS